MSLAQGNNTPTRSRIEPGSPDPESDALTTRPVRSPKIKVKDGKVKLSYLAKYILPHHNLPEASHLASFIRVFLPSSTDASRVTFLVSQSK